MNSREGLSIGKILELEKALFNKEYRREGMKRTHTHTHTRPDVGNRNQEGFDLLALNNKKSVIITNISSVLLIW